VTPVPPTATLVPTPSVTRTGPPIGPTSGTVVFRRGNDLWLAPLDGSAPPRPVTTGARGAGFAGAVRLPNGNIDIFFVVQTGEPAVVEDRYEADLVLFREGLAPGRSATREVLRYRGRPLEPFLGANAAVSPDGAHVLYSDADGISLLELSSGESRRLLTNSPPCIGTNNCFAYHHPRWSPDGERVLILKTFWEGGADILIDPFAATVEEVRTPGGGAFTATWSPDGARVCVSEFTYASAGAPLVYTVATGEFAEASAQLDLPPPPLPDALVIDARGCAWAPDGRLAFGYAMPNDYANLRIAVVDASFAVLAQSGPVEGHIQLAGWLPDGSDLLYNRWHPQTGMPLPPAVFVPGEGVRSLPFDADSVVGVIP
jgi:hypothetical protein